MFVIKRDGRKEPVHFDKITSRIRKLCFGLSDHVEPIEIAQKVCLGVYKGVTTVELDTLAAETAAQLVTRHPDYAILASRLAVSNLHKQTKKSFSDVIRVLYEYTEPRTGQNASLIAEDVYEIVQRNADRLDAAVVHARDYDYDFFGFKTLERSYLLKINGEVVERPQHMLMRVAVGIHKDSISSAIATYNLLSEKWFTHASPTLFNAGTPRPQLSSCFLLTMKDDSIEGIYDTLKQCAQISKNAGGIGVSIHNIRASGSYIKGTNGTSNGLVPMLKVFNDTARYVDQGGGKRKGSFAIYLEPWHADVELFLDLKKNHGKEEMRARDLFYALWIPDLFMERVKNQGTWSLFCPNEAPGLADCYGESFNKLYTSYEFEGRARKTVKARDLWQKILSAQIETGTPYIMFKDACNEKSNQKNLGTIRSSNLCTEIVEYSSAEEVAVCNLASISLPKFVDTEARKFSHGKLFEVVGVIVRNLNKVIDINFYPIPETERSNKRHRPIGIGVQGLADCFILMRLPFDSDKAKQLNREVFETIYFAAVSASCDLARVSGRPYETFAGSPMSEGKFQFDLWDKKANKQQQQQQLSGRWDWETLRKDVVKYGVMNSLLIAPMPTASTSQILGNNECIEPYTSNCYVRRVLAGEFMVVNKHLMRDLIALGIWTPELKNELIAHNGSVQKIAGIPDDIKALYKTAWEIKQRDLIDMAADRAIFIDQSQSLNIFMRDANFAKLTSMHFYSWEKGLKTGMYYLRTKAASDAIQFTVDQTKLKQQQKPRPKPKRKQSATSAPSDLAMIPEESDEEKEKEKEKEQDGSSSATLVIDTEAVRTTTGPCPSFSADSTPVSAPEQEAAAAAAKEEIMCSLDNRDECLSCGS